MSAELPCGRMRGGIPDASCRVPTSGGLRGVIQNAIALVI